MDIKVHLLRERESEFCLTFVWSGKDVAFAQYKRTFWPRKMGNRPKELP